MKNYIVDSCKHSSKVKSLEFLCLMRLVNVIEKTSSFNNKQSWWLNGLHCNLSVKLLSILLRRGLLSDNLIIDMLVSFHRLETNNYFNELNLSDSINNITNMGFDILLEKLNYNLKILIFNSNSSIKQVNNFANTDSLFLISKYCSNLRHLELKNSYLIRDDGLKEVCKKCIHLERINCAGCIHLSNVSLVSASELKHLKSINFSQTNVDDYGIEMFLSKVNIMNLEEMIFNSCKNLTKSSIELIFRKCLNLKYFSFNDCPQIDAQFNDFNQNCLKEIVWTFH